MKNKIKTSFLGLGVMGFPMAGHLAAGSDLTVYNRSNDKAQKWSSEYKGRSASTISEAVKEAQFVFACVGNDADSLAVAKQAISTMTSGSTYIDHTTTSSTCAREINSLCKGAGIRFIDAPVSGGEAGAINGALSAMCGAAPDDLNAVKPHMSTYTKRIVHVGGVGDGQLCKAANQIAIAGLLQGLSEAVHFTREAGLDSDKVLEAISGGAAQSWQMENRWHTMVKNEFDFGFAVDWMIKDLGIVQSEADQLGIELPITKTVADYYEKVREQGGARFDTSSLVTLLAKKKN